MNQVSPVLWYNKMISGMHCRGWLKSTKVQKYSGTNRRKIIVCLTQNTDIIYTIYSTFPIGNRSFPLASVGQQQSYRIRIRLISKLERHHSSISPGSIHFGQTTLSCLISFLVIIPCSSKLRFLGSGAEYHVDCVFVVPDLGPLIYG